MTNSFHQKMLTSPTIFITWGQHYHIIFFHIIISQNSNMMFYLLTWTSLSSLSSRILSAVSASNISVACVAVSCSSAKSAVTSANCKIIKIEVNLILPLHQLANCKKISKEILSELNFISILEIDTTIGINIMIITHFQVKFITHGTYIQVKGWVEKVIIEPVKHSCGSLTKNSSTSIIYFPIYTRFPQKA